ncbi:MAG: hypothetical protein KDL31_12175, partial [Kiritimatiellae bacterium]|nr:hypothetical protein [Kiritimatiellia bacterium]
STWKASDNLRIRFSFFSDGSLNAEGWNIDDVAITEWVPPPALTQLREGFESGLTNWINGQWATVTDDVLSGSAALGDDLPTDALARNDMQLVLNRPMDLTGLTDPQITFWMKGDLSYYGGYPYPRADFYVQMSKDDGVSWANLAGQSANWSSDWTRKQASIPADYRVAGFRLRLRAYASSSTEFSLPGLNLWIDKLTIADRPAGVLFESPVEGLKSMGLSWTESTLGASFQRYEVYRSPDATVDLNDMLIGSFTNITDTAMTDTGLEIGTTYHYGIFVVSDDDAYATVATTSGQTQPLTALDDPMENLDNWVSTGNWGVDTQRFYSGSASLTESPIGGYSANESSYILTSVNLQVQDMDWPILSFFDRYVLANNDHGVVEVSPNGSNWTRLYGAMPESSTNWRLRQLDLSPWKNEPNLRIKFGFFSDGSSNAEGWNIDNVAVTDWGQKPAETTLHEAFDDGLTNWINAQWAVVSDDVISGSAALGDRLPTDQIARNAMQLILSHPLDLSGSEDPQITFWMKGNLSYYGGYPYPRADFYVQMSRDDGVNWVNLVGQGANWSSDWILKQATIPTDYRVANLRLRLNAYGGSSSEFSTPNMNLWIDKLTINERPAGVAFIPPVPALKSIDLGWTQSTLGGAFQRYEVYRSLDTTVDMNDEKIGMISNLATTAMTDTGLEIGRTYYYGIYVVDANDTYSIIATTASTTVPLSALNDPMESLANWVSTGGTWGVDTQFIHNGSGSLADTPFSAYPNGSDTYILTSVNLRDQGMLWPVLHFHDRYDFAAGDSGTLEVSPDGTSWTRLYCAMPSTQTNWIERLIDLSPWRTQANLRIKFRVKTDANLNAYGWNLDDVVIEDHVPSASRSGFYDGFNQGLDHWIQAQWATVTDHVVEGTAALDDGLPGDQVNNASVTMVLNGPLDLSEAVDPKLVFWMKGNLDRSSSSPYPNTDFRVQLSKDQGLTWYDLFLQGGTWSADWTLREASVPILYRTNNVRLRVVYNGTSSGWVAWEGINLWVDSLGIGDPTPGAPSLLSPGLFESVGILRPVLTVGNASDYQSDPLTYRFEVYGDEGLSNLVAQVPSISGGVTSTAWQVDVNLTDNAQYWWRVRANDGSNDGPWMATSTFYVNETNAPPAMVVIAGPPKGATLRTADGNLSWYPTTDPDVGDDVVSYQLQVDEDTGFGSPEIDTTFDAPVLPATSAYLTLSRPLSSFSGWENLGIITNYFWRIRAQDSRFAWSPWTSDGEWFIYGVTPPNTGHMTLNANGSITMQWVVGTEDWYIHWAPSLTGAWQTVAGPLGINSWTFTPSGGMTQGFYRVSGD